MNFLLGNILWVSPSDIFILGILDALVVILVLLLHNRFLAICFDEDQARLQGVEVNKLYILLLTLIAITVVLLMQIVGIILVMTMLILPPTIANLYTRRLSHMMIMSVILSAVFSFVGTALSFFLDWPVGATIALLTGIGYVIATTLGPKARIQN